MYHYSRAVWKDATGVSGMFMCLVCVNSLFVSVCMINTDDFCNFPVIQTQVDWVMFVWGAKNIYGNQTPGFQRFCQTIFASGNLQTSCQGFWMNNVWCPSFISHTDTVQTIWRNTPFLCLKVTSAVCLGFRSALTELQKESSCWSLQGSSPSVDTDTWLLL